jgi:uncharacterized protein (TIGR02301 family)
MRKCRHTAQADGHDCDFNKEADTVNHCRAIALIVAMAMVAMAGNAVIAQEPGGPDQPLLEQPPPPYEPQLLRLSEILGAVQYLRQLCDSDEGSLWRDEMLGILDAETPTPMRRARLVDRFNQGFDSFRSVYRTCTPAAIAAIDRYMEEGADITRDLTARYGESGG